MNKLIRLGPSAIPASEVEAIARPLGRVIAVVTKNGRHYLADYPTHRETDEALQRLMDEWDAWGAEQS